MVKLPFFFTPYFRMLLLLLHFDVELLLCLLLYCHVNCQLKPQERTLLIKYKETCSTLNEKCWSAFRVTAKYWLSTSNVPSKQPANWKRQPPTLCVFSCIYISSMSPAVSLFTHCQMKKYHFLVGALFQLLLMTAEGNKVWKFSQPVIWFTITGGQFCIKSTTCNLHPTVVGRLYYVKPILKARLHECIWREMPLNFRIHVCYM